MIWQRARRISSWIGLIVAASFLLTVHQITNPALVTSIRVALLLLVVLLWRHIVDLLVSCNLVHPLRRASAIAFRWRFLILAAMIEVFVIQQLPELVVDALGA